MKTCSKCGQPIGHRHSKYVVTATGDWLDPVRRNINTLKEARRAARMLGPASVIHVLLGMRENSAGYWPKGKKLLAHHRLDFKLTRKHA